MILHMTSIIDARQDMVSEQRYGLCLRGDDPRVDYLFSSIYCSVSRQGGSGLSELYIVYYCGARSHWARCME